MLKPFTTHLRYILLSVSLMAIFASCTKPPTKGIITVQDLATGDPVAGANVRLFMDDAAAGFFVCNEGFVSEKVYVTNSGGKVDICFEHPSVINVEVTANGKSGSGKLSLQVNETSETTIKIN